MKKTIALTLLSLASVFALSTTSVQAEESDPNLTSTTTTNINVAGDGIKISVPSPLQFNGFTINGETGNKELEASEAFSLIVNDLRGTHKGWDVSASITPLSYTNGEVKDDITGASIALKNGVLSDPFETATPGDATLGIKENIEITTSETPISTAKPGEGMGNWSHDWTEENTKLIIPAKEARDMYEGKYTTTINWKLVAGPQVTESAAAE